MKNRKDVRWAISILLIFLVLFLGLYAYTQIEVSRIEGKYPPVGEFASTAHGEVEIHYLRRGSGTPVVMLHGRDGTLQEFTLSIFDIVADHYEAIALDRPGYGYSECLDPDQLTTKAQARLINEALTKLDVERPIMLGHSYGAAVMLQYLLDYPDQVSGAISLGGVAFVDEPPEEGFFALPRYPVIGPLLTNTVVVPFGRHVARGIYEQAFWPAEVPEKYIQTIASLYLRPAQFTATSLELAAMHYSVEQVSRRYDEISVPVTIIFGDSDQMLDYRQDGQRLYERVPQASLVLVEDAGHKVHHTHPEVVMEAIARLAGKIEQ